MANENTSATTTEKPKGLIQNINLKTKECSSAIADAAGISNLSRAGFFRLAVAEMARKVLSENEMLSQEYADALDTLENGESDDSE